MKQSNWLLGIGIVVAIILIVGSFFLSSDKATNSKANEPEKIETSAQILNIIIKPFKSISSKISLIQ
ncbi:MAG: hypothetical protein ABFS32_03140 [Bacteroidota bacterium]